MTTRRRSLFLRCMLWLLLGSALQRCGEAKKTDLAAERAEKLEDMFGRALYHWTPTSEGNEKIAKLDTTLALQNVNVVGIYFSASWCGPCQEFTPKLISYYEKLKKRTNSNFEIIWISHDQTSDQFVSYFQQMPWLALAADRVGVEGKQLAEKFDVQGIPNLIILDVSTGSEFSVISKDGVRKILKDPYALEFPYKSKLSVVKSLVPRSIRNYLKVKKERSLSLVKTNLRALLAALSPRKIMWLVLSLIKNRMRAILRILFPKLFKDDSNQNEL